MADKDPDKPKKSRDKKRHKRRPSKIPEEGDPPSRKKKHRRRPSLAVEEEEPRRRRRSEAGKEKKRRKKKKPVDEDEEPLDDPVQKKKKKKKKKKAVANDDEKPKRLKSRRSLDDEGTEKVGDSAVSIGKSAASLNGSIARAGSPAAPNGVKAKPSRRRSEVIKRPTSSTSLRISDIMVQSMDPPEEKVDKKKERLLQANNLEFNVKHKYIGNKIKTAKYNIATFMPINLFEQFQRFANFYFFVLLILQLLPWISSLTPLTTGLPLLFVLTVTAVKDGIDDWKRHLSDSKVNNRKSHIMEDGKLIKKKWMDVKVGDIVRLENNHHIAADLLLLTSSEPHSLVYIETAELDGETNLKVRQALPETAVLGNSGEAIKEFDAKIRCEAPNNILDKFEGTLSWKEEEFSLNNDQMLLRGCVLRNSKWCFGLVVFAGNDTKLMQNSGKAILKRTSIDKLLNKVVIFIFAFLIILCGIAAISGGYWEGDYGSGFQAYLPWASYTTNPEQVASLSFLSYIIVLNTLVPISLYVTVEMIRLAQSMLLNWDLKMYDEERETPAKARTTTLNEELGQIKYIFSDKTGTLTRNIMTFHKCSLAGKLHGYLFDKAGEEEEINEDTVACDLTYNKFYDGIFKWYDTDLLDKVTLGDKNAWLFFRVLSLCHTVMAEENEQGEIEYKVQSPDEAALVQAARNFGFVFKSRTPATITLIVDNNEEIYELLNIFDFNNERKRMSVVCRYMGKVRLYCKGADNVIFERLDPISKLTTGEVTQQHLNKFANEGLRTLCLAYKDIEFSEYQDWKKKYHKASISLENREQKVQKCYEELEQNLTLIGATAIEDKLQDGVPETIANLSQANINIWVLTGDKQETAINIGYSCRLLHDDMNEVYFIQGDNKEKVREEIEVALDALRGSLAERDEDDDKDEVEYVQKDPSEIQGVYSYGMVISGSSLAFALEDDLAKQFVEAACYCNGVICCRMTPLQKALVVQGVKKFKDAVTLAIGDGANDVSMIKTAHIGIGISGQEGMQAVLSSDYAISQFRFLERLLLVHGRWSYYRMCKFLDYFFYKNIAFTMAQFWYCFYCGYSAQPVYDEWFITIYNIVFTSLPVIALGIFDQDVSDENCMKYPKLYIPGQTHSGFSFGTFLKSALYGVITSLVLFFVPYGTFNESMTSTGKTLDDVYIFGTVVGSILVIVVNVQIALDTYYWTWLNHLTIWGSFATYWITIFLFYCDPFYAAFGTAFNYVGVSVQMTSQAIYWLTVLLVLAMLFAPVCGKRAIVLDVMPSLADLVRRKEKEDKEEVIYQGEDGGVELTRAGSTRRSFRPGSASSGYAFSHAEGFGDLITSGRSMKSRGPGGEGDTIQEIDPEGGEENPGDHNSAGGDENHISETDGSRPASGARSEGGGAPLSARGSRPTSARPTTGRNTSSSLSVSAPRMNRVSPSPVPPRHPGPNPDQPDDVDLSSSKISLEAESMV